MQFGDLELLHVSGGSLRLDGGTMFGVVPKSLWQRRIQPDDENRIGMNTNCLLVRDGDNTVLIDTGYGTKLDQKQRDAFAMPEQDVLVENLARCGVAPGEVQTVVLTHLHFDHVGGATRYDRNGRLVPTFPNARHVIQRVEWETATSGLRELRNSYPAENFRPLEEAGLIDRIDGNVEIAPGIHAMVTGGHTAAHQAITIGSAGMTAIYLGDLCPLVAHLKQLWCMSYDLFPLETRRRKPEILGRAADEDWLVLWDHDPNVVAGRLQRDPRSEFVVIDPRSDL